MTYWQWLDARADRKDAHRFMLIERGLDARSMLLKLFGALDAKFFIAMTIIALFGWAFAQSIDDDNTRNLMIGAIIAAFAGAWGYYLGSSNSAHKAADRADNLAVAAAETARKLPEPVPQPVPTERPLDPSHIMQDSDGRELWWNGTVWVPAPAPATTTLQPGESVTVGAAPDGERPSGDLP